MPGWYYHRLTFWQEDASAPDGKHYIYFENEIAGRASHLLQGFPIDGSHIGEVTISAWVKADHVEAGKEVHEVPVVAITFYDEQRRDLGTSWIGPFRGTKDWQQYDKTFRVPIQAREGILRLGLFGATGKISFDKLEMKALAR